MAGFTAGAWPLFWTIIGAVAVTVLLCLLVATFSPSWFSRHHRRQGRGTQLPAGRARPRATPGRWPLAEASRLTARPATGPAARDHAQAARDLLPYPRDGLVTR